MRFFVVFCLIFLILSVAFFADLRFIPTAHAQDCQPTLSTEATPQPSTKSIVINEVIPSPVQAPLYCAAPASASSAVDILPKGPWIEIYNTLAQPLQLVHASLDSGPNTNPFLLTNTSILAHGFIVAFPFSNTNFMRTFGSKLRLMLNDTPLDQVELPTTLLQDTSYARIPDGSSSWQITPDITKNTTTTMGKSNNIVLAMPTSRAQKKSTPKTKSQTSKKTPIPKSINDLTSNQVPPSTSSSSSSSSQSSTPKSKILQLQPNWKLVRLPTHVATSISSNPAAPDQATITPVSSPPDTLKKIALSLLTIALVSVLWWCRKLFFKT